MTAENPTTPTDSDRPKPPLAPRVVALLATGVVLLAGTAVLLAGLVTLAAWLGIRRPKR